MLTQNYLRLHYVKLKRGEEWRQEGQGLAFVFLKAGGGKYTSGAETRRLESGDVLLLKAQSPCILSSRNGGETAFWTFSLCLEHLYPLFDANEISLLQDVVEGLRTVRLYPASTPIAAEGSRLIGEIPPHFDLAHRGQLLRVAASILSNEFSTARQKHAPHLTMQEHVVQVFENLTADELLSLPVEQLAEKFNCSERHLNRLFHLYFGYSASNLRMELRLTRAVALLRDPHIKIIDVAEQCRFSHLGLFNACFSKRFGMSPGRWRKAMAELYNWPEPISQDKLLRCVLEKGFSLSGGQPAQRQADFLDKADYTQTAASALPLDGHTPACFEGSVKANGQRLFPE